MKGYQYRGEFIRAYRAPAYLYGEVIDYLKRWHIEYTDEALKAPVHLNLSSEIVLRD